MRMRTMIPGAGGPPIRRQESAVETFDDVEAVFECIDSSSSKTK